MTGTLLNQGMMLLAYGMGVVFVFLTMLVIATSLMSRLVMRFSGQEEQQSKRISPSTSTSTRPQQDDRQLICVISAAIHHYRKRHKKHH